MPEQQPAQEHIAVSVIVPVHNARRHLARCVDSIMSQTLKDIEIILVDDGSTDTSGKMCDEYAARDGRIRVIHQKNAGMGAACNAGLNAATGEYVAFAEADDWMDPRMYEVLYGIGVAQQTDVVKSLFYEHRDGQQSLCNPFHWEKRAVNSVIRDNDKFLAIRFLIMDVSFWSAIYRREFLAAKHIKFNLSKGASGQDYGFVFLVYVHLASMYIYQASYYHHDCEAKGRASSHGYRYSMNVLQREGKYVFDVIRRRRVGLNYVQVNAVALFLKAWRHLREDCRSAFQKTMYVNAVSALLNRYYDAYGESILLGNTFLQNKRLFAEFINHPFRLAFRSRAAQLFQAKMSLPETHIYACGVPLVYIRNSRDFCTFRILGIPIREMRTERSEYDYKTLRTYRYLGLPLVKQEEDFENVRNYCLNIMTSSAKALPTKDDVIFYSGMANAVADLHRQVFPPYKGVHRGQSLAIFGSGPSIRFAPPAESCRTIACNRSIRIFKDSDPTYFFGIDYGLGDIIEGVLKRKCDIFLGRHTYKFHRDILDPSRMHASGDNVREFYISGHWGDYIRADIEYFALADFGSVVHAALNFALYTEPDVIYLVGCDTTNAGYADKNYVPGTSYDLDRFIEGYRQFKLFRRIHYPETRIVSVNPVGLRGMFEDMYTWDFAVQDQDLDESRVRIIDKM